MWMYATIVVLAFFFPPTLFLKNHVVYDAETQRYRSADWRPHPPGKRKKLGCSSSASSTSGSGSGSGREGVSMGKRQGEAELETTRKLKLLRGARAEVGMEKRAKRVCEMAMEVEEGEERWIEGRRVGTDLLFG